MRRFAFLFLCLVLTPYTAFSQNASPAGKFLAVTDGVFITHENEETPVKKGDAVFMNDIVETDAEARALIAFKDETELVLGGNASLEINSYVFDPNGDTSANEGDFLIQGPFAWMSGLLPKNNENVAITTPLGSIGIRGTTVWGGFLKDEYGVFVFDGAVDFTNESGSALIENGEGVFVREENSELMVKTWGAPKIQAAIDTVAFPEGSVVPSEKYATAFTVKPKAPANDNLIEEDTDLDPEETVPEIIETPTEEKE